MRKTIDLITDIEKKKKRNLCESKNLNNRLNTLIKNYENINIFQIKNYDLIQNKNSHSNYKNNYSNQNVNQSIKNNSIISNQEKIKDYPEKLCFNNDLSNLYIKNKNNKNINFDAKQYQLTQNKYHKKSYRTKIESINSITAINKSKNSNNFVKKWEIMKKFHDSVNIIKSQKNGIEIKKLSTNIPIDKAKIIHSNRLVAEYSKEQKLKSEFSFQDRQIKNQYIIFLSLNIYYFKFFYIYQGKQN